jgi:hypothetical protein
MIIENLKDVLNRRADITEKFAEKGLGYDQLIDTIKELLSATTISKDGTPMDDNDARVRAAELMAEILGLTGSNAQQVNVLKLLMESLGLRKGGGGNVINFNFTDMLYGRDQ